MDTIHVFLRREKNIYIHSVAQPDFHVTLLRFTVKTLNFLAGTYLDTSETIFEFLSLELTSNFILIFALFKRDEYRRCCSQSHH